MEVKSGKTDKFVGLYWHVRRSQPDKLEKRGKRLFFYPNVSLTVLLPDIKLKQPGKNSDIPWSGSPKEELTMSFWERIKKDLEKDARESSGAIRGKSREPSEDIERIQSIDELKSKVRSWMADLGGRVYELSDRIENPMHDMKVEMMVARIRKRESQIRQLETGRKKE